MTKKVLFTSAAMALALSAGSALAADLPSRKGPPVYAPPPPLFTWSGLYVGINAGFTWSDNDNVVTSTVNVFDNHVPAEGEGIGAALSQSGTASAPINSFIGGGQVGYNLQFGAWVGGVEADIQGIADSGRGSFVGFGQDRFPDDQVASVVTSQRSLDWIGTLRGRVGYLVMPNLLVFGTGGMAVGGARLSTSIFSVWTKPVETVGETWIGGIGSFDETRVGWAAGGGVEWMFWPNWSAKVEYLRYDLGSVTTPLSPSLSVAGSAVRTINHSISRAQFEGNIARAGLNYHFNFAPAPVVAKY